MSHSSSSLHHIASPCNILLSFLKRRGSEIHAGRSSRLAKTVQFFDCDIVCLPQEYGTATPILFPRGRNRAQLGEMDLIGKKRISSVMTVQEVENEVRSTFKKAMGDRNDFPFTFL